MMSNKGDTVGRYMCPYNNAHLIMKPRMQQHLVKCRKSAHDLHLEVCTYNSTHRIPAPELPFHLEICPDRRNLDKFIFTTSNAEDKFPMPTLNLVADENWDGVHHSTYNPEEHCINNPILRNKNVLPQAERKHFRMQERQRMQKFQTQKEEIPKELQQKSVQKGRRPYGVSLGVAGATSLPEDEVSTLIEQIDLGASTVSYPTMASTSDANARDEDDLMFKSVKRGIGRGRGLAQK